MFSLNVKYYNLNGKLPHITYEYTVPRPSRDAAVAEGVATGSAHTYGNLTYNEVNGDIGGDPCSATNHSQGVLRCLFNAGQ